MNVNPRQNHQILYPRNITPIRYISELCLLSSSSSSSSSIAFCYLFLPSVRCPATMSSYLHCWSTGSQTCIVTVTWHPGFPSSPCWQILPRECRRCWKDLIRPSSPVNGNTTENEHRLYVCLWAAVDMLFVLSMSFQTFLLLVGWTWWVTSNIWFFHWLSQIDVFILWSYALNISHHWQNRFPCTLMQIVCSHYFSWSLLFQFSRFMCWMEEK